MSLYLVAASTAGLVGPLGGLSLGIVAAYGQRLARMYATVAVAVLMMDNSGIDPALRRGLAVMACEVLKNIALGFFGITKGAEQVVNDFATFEGVVGAAKGKSPFSCS